VVHRLARKFNTAFSHVLALIFLSKDFRRKEPFLHWNLELATEGEIRGGVLIYNRALPRYSMSGKGTKDDPWVLKTPPGTSEFKAYRDDSSTPPALVVWVGKTELKYQLRCLEDLQAMLRKKGDWMELGSADEQKPAKDGTVEAWARSPKNPVGGWYGLKKGLRGRFAMYVPPVMEALKMAEVEHNPKNNRIRAL